MGAAAAVYLCYCTWAFSSCSEWGLLSRCSAWASHWDGFSCFRAWALEHEASVVMAQGLVAPPLPGLGIEAVSPVLVGTFLTSGQPRKPLTFDSFCVISPSCIILPLRACISDTLHYPAQDLTHSRSNRSNEWRYSFLMHSLYFLIYSTWGNKWRGYIYWGAIICTCLALSEHI